MSRERDLEDEYIGFQVDFLCLELTEKGLPCHSDDPCSNCTSKVGGLCIIVFVYLFVFPLSIELRIIYNSYRNGLMGY